MSLLLHYLETALVLVVMFSVLVAAHEYGHYIFARLFNMGVEEFAIGFGKKPIFEWMRRTYQIPLRAGEVPMIEHAPGAVNIEAAGTRPTEDVVVLDTPEGQMLRETTRFTVRPWPVGGFVRIKGMLPEEDGSETTIAGGFYNKPPWKRLIVLFAGPMFSVLAGILILVPLYMVCGIREVETLPIIGPVSEGGAAAKAGLKEGDYVTAIDGKPISSFYQVNQIVRDSANKRLHFSIKRAGRPMSLVLTPILDPDKTPVLGPDLLPTTEMRVQAKMKTHFATRRVNVGVGKAVAMAISRPVDAVVGLFEMVRHPATIKDSVGGTISITRATYDTVDQGFAPILELAAVLSISVGIMNLLPVVPLDGGQMVLSFAELFRGGRRLSMQVQNLATICGMAFIGVLIISVCFLDISRLFDGGPLMKAPPPKKANR